jgi:hypothetical protein
VLQKQRDVLHSKPEQRAALTQLLQVSLLHAVLLQRLFE